MFVVSYKFLVSKFISDSNFFFSSFLSITLKVYLNKFDSVWIEFFKAIFLIYISSGYKPIIFNKIKKLRLKQLLIFSLKLTKNFDILNIILSDKVDITSFEWKLYKPVILSNNQEYTLNELVLQSNFNLKKINSLFSNLSSLTIFKLIELRKSYKILNYSVVDIDSQLYRVISYPIYLTLITIFSSIIMFNIGYQKNTFYKITLGIFLSVVIYYVNYFLNILGTNEKIPLILSIFMPLAMLTIINFTSIIKINEK